MCFLGNEKKSSRLFIDVATTTIRTDTQVMTAKTGTSSSTNGFEIKIVIVMLLYKRRWIAQLTIRGQEPMTLHQMDTGGITIN